MNELTCIDVLHDQDREIHLGEVFYLTDRVSIKVESVDRIHSGKTIVCGKLILNLDD